MNIFKKKKRSRKETMEVLGGLLLTLGQNWHADESSFQFLQGNTQTIVLDFVQKVVLKKGNKKETSSITTSCACNLPRLEETHGISSVHFQMYAAPIGDNLQFHLATCTKCIMSTKCYQVSQLIS